MGLLDIFRKKTGPAEQGDANGIKNSFNDIIDKGLTELKSKKIFAYSGKSTDMKAATDTLLALSDKDRVAFVLTSIKTISNYFVGNKNIGGAEYDRISIVLTLLNHTLRTKLKVDETDVNAIVETFMTHKRFDWSDVTAWPLGHLVTVVERNYKDGLPGDVKKNLELLKEALKKDNRNDKDSIKLISKIDSLLFASSGGAEAVEPTHFAGGDKFGEYANAIIEQQAGDEKNTWYKLMQLAQKASGSKPSAKFLDQGKALIKELPADRFKKIVADWFDFIAKMKEDVQEHTHTYNDRTYTYTTTEFLVATNGDTVKGFVWLCSHFYDSATLKTIASLCERTFRKIPGKGPAAAAVGNACLYTLYKSKGLEGIAHLSRLKLRIKQSSTQALIDKYLQEAAEAEGVTVNEIEDLAVDGYELLDGKRVYEVDGYKATLTIEGIGSVNVEWTKPDGGSLKSVPSLIKDKHPEKLKKIKDTAKQIEVALVAQRDRIDRLFRSQREMSWEYFVKHYLTHGLLSYLTKDILWKFRNGKETWTCIYLRGQWTTLNGQQVQPESSLVVALWHPATATVEEIRAWRTMLVNEQIRQPIKQAFREVYILTDAEVNTRTYSNRMAAHILKQHQFNSLAKTRGWKYSLLGAYDDGRYNEGAELNLPEAKIRAEFWVNEVNADNQFNDTGIWNYVATDQVRFLSAESNEPIELVSIPPVVFSEVMRDVDLFVGVASVGNDPTWADSGGVPAYRDYWTSYSFGELTEIAKMRKEILTGLVPRLKIASVAEVRDKFLVVRGKKRTYKIHIGSTNILMEPNDQYLCIVPDRSRKDVGSGNIFLPFEGDVGLSVILSKAMLLAADDKITDASIISQIDRK